MVPQLPWEKIQSFIESATREGFHHKLEELLDQYLKATGLEKEPGSPLFPVSIGKIGKLSRRPLVRTDGADVLKRRLKQAGLPAHYSPHSFRATGITNFLENDDTLVSGERAVRTTFRKYLRDWLTAKNFSRHRSLFTYRFQRPSRFPWILGEMLGYRGTCY